MVQSEVVVMRNRSALVVAALSISLYFVVAGSSQAIPLGISKDALLGMRGLVGASLRTDWLRNSPAGSTCNVVTTFVVDRR